MTGKTEHHDENIAEIDQALGTDAQSLKDAADAILDAGGDSIEPDDEGSQDPLTILINDLKTVHAEKDELQNQYLLSVAEMENLRKRTRKEIADTREFSIASFARDMLSVTDNLRRAIDAVPAEELEVVGGGLKNLLEGVSMTERELLAAMEKYKVKKMEAMGQKFNPNLHQAMFEVQDKETPNNTIVEIIQDGYVIGERMLRPAMVGVSKGGPKIPVQPVDEDGEEPSSEL